ncbi:hypothetical protein SAY86_026091 [Trapa natans]|uniref:Uncharacterized protein n=1 Tax=Trapa natans TaxID=22666 RepID=A0AAN7QE74_TRANT|nr:hypothetical protein SAY86_026091 [Trapa natans]
METTVSYSNHKRRAISCSSIKTKLASSFSRTVKPNNPFMIFPSKVKPESSPLSSNSKHNLDLSQWSLTPTQKSRPPAVDGQLRRGNYHYYYRNYGVASSGDENVDMKAACYISNVKERFKLDGEF